MSPVRLTTAIGLPVAQHRCATSTLPLIAPFDSNATVTQHDSEGIAHCETGCWSIARDHSASAIRANSHLAKSNFDPARALHKPNRHSEANAHFGEDSSPLHLPGLPQYLTRYDSTFLAAHDEPASAHTADTYTAGLSSWLS